MRKAVVFVAIVLSFSSHAQESGRRAKLLIEATQTMSGIGTYRTQHLWVRLMKDGSLEWEELVWGKANQIHSSQVSQNRVAAIEKDLDSTDWTKSRGKLGPYNVYMDSSVEIQIRVATATGNIRFQLSILGPVT